MSITVRAPARVSVFVRVGSADCDGYHNMAAVYQAVSLYDEVTAEPSDDFSIRFTGPVDTQHIPTDHTNPTLTAARRLAEKTGVDSGVSLTVCKRIPTGGGLGGLAADTVATLVACDELWNTGVDRGALSHIAEEFGTETPFSLAGGTAVWTADGSQLRPALSKGSFTWVLAFTDGSWRSLDTLHTLEAHRRQHFEYFGEIPQEVGVQPQVMQALRHGDPRSLAEAMHNDLQVIAMQVDPHLGRLLEFGESRGALAGIVSETGSTVAFLVDGARSAATLRHVLGREGVHTLTVTGPVSGARRIDHLPESLLTQPISLP